jgi:ADP-ribosylation factor related protein 1
MLTQPCLHSHTVGLNVGRIEAFNHNLVIWDLGGQTGLQSIWDKYYDESHAVIYVVDSANPARFLESKQALDRVLGARELFGAPVILMANKQDLPEATSPHDIGEDLGFGKVDSRSTKIVPVCAYTGQGLKESVEWLVETVKRSPRATRLRMKHVK